MHLKSIARRGRRKMPMEELESVRITPETGIEGDARGKPGNRQVTILSAESWHQVCGELGMELPWLLRRANLLIEGFEFLPTDIGRRIQIGDVELEITRETDPCSRMEEQQPGLYEALQPLWRGGVCCRVIQGGEVAVGAPLSISG